MKTFVTGATGFVGNEVTRHLSRAGHSLRLLVRYADSPRAARLARETGSELVCGDVTDPNSLAAATRGCDAIVHLVGIISEARSLTFERIHAQGTSNLVAAAARNGVPRFVHMSALGTRPGAASRYHRSKWEAETSVRSAPFAWTLFRPSIIYGPEDRFVNLFARTIRWSPAIPVIGSGKTRLQPVSVGAVAEAFAGSVGLAASHRRAFDLVGPEILTFNQVIGSIEEVLGRRRLKVHIPFGLARLQARFLEVFVGRLLGKPPPLNRDQLIMLEEDNTGDFATATNLFRLRHPTFVEGIAEYLASRT